MPYHTMPYSIISHAHRWINFRQFYSGYACPKWDRFQREWSRVDGGKSVDPWRGNRAAALPTWWTWLEIHADGDRQSESPRRSLFARPEREHQPPLILEKMEDFVFVWMVTRSQHKIPPASSYIVMVLNLFRQISKTHPTKWWWRKCPSWLDKDKELPESLDCLIFDTNSTAYSQHGFTPPGLYSHHTARADTPFKIIRPNQNDIVVK